jgi:hypothetical protein
MASRVVQQVLRTARTTSKQTQVLDRKFAHPFTDDGAGPANMYNSITTRPTPTAPRAAKASATATGGVGKAYATVAPTASGMPLKSAAGKFSMAFDEGPYLKPTLENAVEHVEMLSKLSQGHGIKASAEQMQKILAVGAMRL